MMTKSKVKPKVRGGSDIVLGLWDKVKCEWKGHKLI